jgi:hypothetical protein
VRDLSAARSRRRRATGRASGDGCPSSELATSAARHLLRGSAPGRRGGQTARSWIENTMVATKMQPFYP